MIGVHTLCTSRANEFVSENWMNLATVIFCLSYSMFTKYLFFLKVRFIVKPVQNLSANIPIVYITSKSENRALIFENLLFQSFFSTYLHVSGHKVIHPLFYPFCFLAYHLPLWVGSLYYKVDYQFTIGINKWHCFYVDNHKRNISEHLEALISTIL